MRGKKMGRSWEHFIKEGAFLGNRADDVKDYKEEAGRVLLDGEYPFPSFAWAEKPKRGGLTSKKKQSLQQILAEGEGEDAD